MSYVLEYVAKRSVDMSFSIVCYVYNRKYYDVGTYCM